MTAQLLTDSIPTDVCGWWASEKLDGVRAIWTGTSLLTRHGKRLNAPAWFTDGLPSHRLDGELWMGPQSFDRLVSAIQKKEGSWEGVRFFIFDLAESGTFEERNAALQKIPMPCHCVRIPHRQLSGGLELDLMEKNIVKAGGEGCVIRRPGCLYRPGRMGDVIKVKRLVEDADRWQG